MVLVLHVFQEWPAAFPRLLQIGAKVKEFTDIQAIVPAEFQLQHDGQMHYGFWNNKSRKMAVAHWNI